MKNFNKISEKVEKSAEKLAKMVKTGVISPETLLLHIKIEADLLKIHEILIINAMKRLEK